MKSKKFAIVVFVWSLIASLIFGYPFVTDVLGEWLTHGMNVDWALNLYMTASTFTALATCIYSFRVMRRDPAENDSKTTIALSILLTLTTLALSLFLMIVYVASKY